LRNIGLLTESRADNSKGGIGEDGVVAERYKNESGGQKRMATRALIAAWSGYGEQHVWRAFYAQNDKC